MLRPVERPVIAEQPAMPVARTRASSTRAFPVDMVHLLATKQSKTGTVRTDLVCHRTGHLAPVVCISCPGPRAGCRFFLGFRRAICQRALPAHRGPDRIGGAPSWASKAAAGPAGRARTSSDERHAPS